MGSARTHSHTPTGYCKGRPRPRMPAVNTSRICSSDMPRLCKLLLGENKKEALIHKVERGNYCHKDCRTAERQLPPGDTLVFSRSSPHRTQVKLQPVSTLGVWPPDGGGGSGAAPTPQAPPSGQKSMDRVPPRAQGNDQRIHLLPLRSFYSGFIHFITALV